MFDVFPEGILGQGGISGFLPDTAGKVSAGGTADQPMFPDTALIDRAGISGRGMKYLSAGFIAALAEFAVETAGRTFGSAAAEAENLSLLFLAESVQNEMIGFIQHVFQQIIRTAPSGRTEFQ